jgi:hypothetical protein
MTENAALEVASVDAELKEMLTVLFSPVGCIATKHI